MTKSSSPALDSGTLSLETVASDLPHSSTTTLARRPLYHRVLTGSHVRNNVLLIGANLIAALCGYLLQSALGHLLGLAAYGTFAALIALSSILLIPTQVISTVVAKYGATLSAAGQLGRFNDLLQRLTLILLPMGIGVAIIFVAGSGYIAAFLRLDSMQGVIAIGVMFVPSFIISVNIGAVQGLQRFNWYAVLVALPMVLRFGMAVGMVALGFGVSGAMLGIVGSLCLSYLVSFRALRSLWHAPRSSCGSLRSLATYSTTATVALTMTVLLSNMDTILAKHFLSAQQAGLYAALAVIGKIVLLMSNSVVTVMFPRFATLHNRGECPTRTVLETILGVVALVIGVEATFYVAPALIARLLFGPSFVAIAAELPWYGLAMLLLGLAQVFIYYFLATGDRRFTLLLLICTALQGTLLTALHHTVEQLVQALVIGNGMLALLMCALFVVGTGQRRQRNRAPL